jgi:hypothetical protein
MSGGVGVFLIGGGVCPGVSVQVGLLVFRAVGWVCVYQGFVCTMAEICLIYSPLKRMPCFIAAKSLFVATGHACTRHI